MCIRDSRKVDAVGVPAGHVQVAGLLGTAAQHHGVVAAPVSYTHLVFTTSVVAYPGVPHIDEGRDFSPVIEKALELGGYAQDTLLSLIHISTRAACASIPLSTRAS